RFQDAASALGLEFKPRSIGAVAERGIGLAFEIEAPEDSTRTMRRTARVADLQRIEPQYVAAAALERMQRGAAHQAEADDADVTASHRELHEQDAWLTPPPSLSSGQRLPAR